MNTVVLLTDAAVVAARPSRRGVNPASVVRVPADVPLLLRDDGNFTDLADSIASATALIGGNEPVTLIVLAGWCYSHAIELPRRRAADRTAAFQLEEFLPEPLDGLTCAFSRGRDRRAFGVAVRTTRLRPLLDALAARGTIVERITMDALCVSPESWSGEAAGSYGVLLKDVRRRVTALYPHREEPPVIVRTVHGPPDDRTLAEQIALSETGCGNNADLWHVRDLSDDKDCHAIMATAIHDRRQPNLAVGPLAPARPSGRIDSALTRVAAALVIFLTALLVNRWTSVSRYQDSLAAVQSRADELFRSVFPNESASPAPAMRLASERLRLERLTQTVASDADIDLATRGLGLFDILRDAVAQLPPDVRLNLAEISVDDRQLTLRGRTTDHRQAERVAESIGRVHGWSVRPPRTSRLDTDGVEFTLRATTQTNSPEPRTVTLAD